MKLLFLDIDGVLNDHTRTPSGYCGIQADKVSHLNFILKEAPEVQIVISSAWRYIMLRGDIITPKSVAYVSRFKRMHSLQYNGKGNQGPDGLAEDLLNLGFSEEVIERFRAAAQEIIYRREVA